MSFFPADFDPRAQVTGVLDLVEVDHADGTERFLIGIDGQFRDTSGNLWLGSAMASVTGLESAIDGVAPEGSLVMSYFQDPTMPDLMLEIRDLGLDYVKGREVRFYIQPLMDVAEFYAPTVAPLRWLTRISRQVSYRANGARDRAITLSFETWAERRGAARRIALNTEGHAILTGSANPSLKYMPTVDFEPEKLFG